ncbi:MAG: Gldg family protein [Rhodospirillaceae bacterium]
MNRRQLPIAALGVAAILFLAINVLAQAGLRQARLDLTADRLFTLSQGTRNILGGLKDPITLKLYFSESLAAAAPQFRTYGQRVRELLEEYANRSHGMITLQVLDPEPFSDAEDRAVAAGLQGVPLDQASGSAAYFGLIGTGATDTREVIPFFNQDREPFLEYDLSRLVYALSDPKKPVVGVISDMDLTFGPGGMAAAMRGEIRPYAFLQQLRQNFDVRVLKNDLATVDADVTVLLVLRPQKLADKALYAIDRYVTGGGHAVLYVDPFAESAVDQTGPDGTPRPAIRTATLTKLFQAWGIEMDDKHFVADPSLAIRVGSGEGSKRRAVPYPAWLNIAPENINPTDMVTARLSGLTVGSAGALAKRKDAEISFTPLFFTSPRAQMLDTAKLGGAQPDPEEMMAALAPTGETKVLAARISGTLKSAFPDGPPGAKPGDPKPAPVAKPTDLIVVADTDILEDRFWVQEQNFLGQRIAVPFASNADFLVNAIDNLTGSSDLIGLRGRAGAARPFVMVENLHRAAGEQFLAREQALRKKLEQAQRQITELQNRQKAGSGSGALLSKEEQATIERFKGEVLQTRKELREVQHTLNRDIERLGATLKAINIGLMPLLVAGFALGLAGWRARRRARTVHD